MTTPHPAQPPGPASSWPYDGTAPAASAPTGLAGATAILAAVLTGIEVVSAVAAWPAAARFADQIRAGGSAYDVFTLWDVVELLGVPVLVAAYVVTCLWLHAARSNTARISPATRHQRGRVWVWLGWWVPIVSLWFPYQVVRDVRAGSSTYRVGAGGLGGWWAAWLTYVVLSRAATNMGSSGSIGAVEALPYVETVAAAAALAACVQWIRIVRSITTAQEEALRPR